MKAHVLKVLLLLVAVFALAGCGGGGGGNDESSTYQDDFTDNSGQWNDNSTQTTRLFMEDGKYFIAFLEPQQLAVSGPGEVFGTDTVENPLEDSEQNVEAQGREGDISMGLLCRWNGEADTIEGYIFALVQTSKGKRAVIYNATGSIPPDTLESGSADEIDFRASNDLEASCKGNELSFKVNGDEVVTATDTSHQSGQNGVFAARLTDTPAQAVAIFDNYETTR